MAEDKMDVELLNQDQSQSESITTIGSVKVNQQMQMVSEDGSVVPATEEVLKQKITYQKIGVDIPILPTDEEVNIISKRVGKLEGLESCNELKVLCLRNNLITKIENISSNVNLVELELYDNKIVKIEGLETLVNLRLLDLSYNNIKKIEGLENLKQLERLFLLSNKIKTIENLDFPLLTMIELGSNKISQIQNLDKLPALKQLYLGKNRIVTVQNLEPLKETLTTLALTANCIKTIESGLEQLINLEELYVAENFLTKIQGIEKLVDLDTLDLSMNKIAHLEGINTLTNLTELWLNSNLIENFEDLDVLKSNSLIETIYLQMNPVARFPSYRQKIMDVLPNISQIDATMLHVDYNVKKN